MAALQPERKPPSGSVSKRTPRSPQLLHGRRRLRVSTSTALGAAEPRPAASVSAAWRSGESSAASAAASPPWAQKLELSASGLRETSATRAPSPGGLKRDVQAGGPAADHDDVAGAGGVGGGGRAHGRGYGIAESMALYFSHPRSLQHDTGPHPENARRLVAIEAALERRRLGRHRAGRGPGGDP